jgi:hypothetical protein
MMPWYKQKTTWTAIGGGVTAIGGYLTGEISLIAAMGSVFAALAVIFGRQGIEKSGYGRSPSQRGEILEENE